VLDWIHRLVIRVVLAVRFTLPASAFAPVCAAWKTVGFACCAPQPRIRQAVAGFAGSGTYVAVISCSLPSSESTMGATSRAWMSRPIFTRMEYVPSCAAEAGGAGLAYTVAPPTVIVTSYWPRPVHRALSDAPGARNR